MNHSCQNRMIHDTYSTIRHDTRDNRFIIVVELIFVQESYELQLNRMYRAIHRNSIETEIRVKKCPNKKIIVTWLPRCSIPIANNCEFEEGFKPSLRSLKKPSVSPKNFSQLLWLAP